MLDPKKINEFVEGVLGAMPDGVKNMSKEVEDNLRAAAQVAFRKMDLVTREEFDSQAKVLLRTREKLEALEKHVAALEKQQGKK